jgi:D-aminopeptidase
MDESGVRAASRHAVRFDERRVDAIFEELNQCQLPGAAVGIAIGGTPVYRKGFGLASMELPVALSPSIRMRIGSTSKQFACFALLLLCEEGRARLDDAVGTWLPELHAVVRRVTLRELMNNTSGLRDAHDICWLFSGRGLPVTSAAILAQYYEIPDVNCGPGTSWIYCNGGFLLVSAVIERITGQSLEEALRTRVFEPIGMHDSLLRRWDTDFVSNSATLHMSRPVGGYDRSYMGTALAGEGGIVSTIDDMLRWLAHMDRAVVGSPATWDVMRRSGRLANGISTGYGAGLITSDYRGVETLYHSGGVLGGNAQMLKVPGAALDIVVLVNRSDMLAMQLVHRILDACLPDLDPVVPRPEGPFARGIYRSPVTGRIVQLFARNAEQIASIDATDIPVEHDAKGALVPAGVWSYLKQVLELEGPKDRPTAIRLTHFGNTDELLAVEPVEGARQSAIVGRYRSEAIGTELIVSSGHEEVQLTSHGRFGTVSYRLESIAADIWRLWPANPAMRGALVSLDAEGAVLRISNDRLWGLPFERQA